MSIKDDLLPEMVAPPPKLEPNIKEEIQDPDFPDQMSEEDRQKMREKYDKEADEISNYDSEESEDELIPEPKKRVVIPKKDIFKSISNKVSSGNAESDVPQIKKVKQKRKPRGPPSEKQLEALARAREKGAETRRKKAEEKKKIKELENEVKRQEIEEKKKSLERKLKKPVFKEEVEYKEKKMEEDYNRQLNESKPPVNKKVVEDTIEKAVEKGIAEYEMKRKARKEEKKKRIEKEEYDKKVLNTVQRAINPDDYWSECFR